MPSLNVFFSLEVGSACQDFASYKFEPRHHGSLAIHHFLNKIQSQPQPEEIREPVQVNNSLKAQTCSNKDGPGLPREGST